MPAGWWGPREPASAVLMVCPEGGKPMGPPCCLGHERQRKQTARTVITGSTYRAANSRFPSGPAGPGRSWPTCAHRRSSLAVNAPRWVVLVVVLVAVATIARRSLTTAPERRLRFIPEGNTGGPLHEGDFWVDANGALHVFFGGQWNKIRVYSDMVLPAGDAPAGSSRDVDNSVLVPGAGGTGQAIAEAANGETFANQYEFNNWLYYRVDRPPIVADDEPAEHELPCHRAEGRGLLDQRWRSALRLEGRPVGPAVCQRAADGSGHDAAAGGVARTASCGSTPMKPISRCTSSMVRCGCLLLTPVQDVERRSVHPEHFRRLRATRVP